MTILMTQLAIYTAQMSISMGQTSISLVRNWRLPREKLDVLMMHVFINIHMGTTSGYSRSDISIWTIVYSSALLWTLPRLNQRGKLNFIYFNISMRYKGVQGIARVVLIEYNKIYWHINEVENNDRFVDELVKIYSFLKFSILFDHF